MPELGFFPNGAIKQFTYGNGIVHAMTQNARQLPERSRGTYGGVSIALDDSYDYDFNGNVAAISDGLAGNRGNRTMTYDGLDRLTSATPPMFSGTVAYTYDVLDNLQTVTAPGPDLRYCYNGANQLEFLRTDAADCNSSGASTYFDWDVQGNVAWKNSQQYIFSHDNRLRAVVGVETYRYDGHGRRVLSWSATGLGNLFSMYSSDGVLRQITDARAKQLGQSYIYLGGSVVAVREKTLAGGVVTVKYQHTDALGTPVAVTDASRNVVKRNEYGPYGKLLTGTHDDTIGYTGHVEDRQTGLTYMQQRYYDPVVGTFLSVDPVTVSSTGGNFNRFWYANNNPYGFVDPDGRQPRRGEMNLCGTPGLCGTSNGADIAAANGQGSESGSGSTTSDSGSAIPSAPTPEQLAAQQQYGQQQQSNGPDLFSNGNIFDVESLAHDLFPLVYMTPEGAGVTAAARGTFALSLKLAMFEGRLGPSGQIFGRRAMGGSSVLRINRNDFVRIGWGWKGGRNTGQHVFRVSSEWLKTIGIKSGHIDILSLPPQFP